MTGPLRARSKAKVKVLIVWKKKIEIKKEKLNKNNIFSLLRSENNNNYKELL